MTDPKPPVIVKLHPLSEDYAEVETEFLRALGLCVSQWAFVDRQLFRLFRYGLQTATHRAATVYYKPKTLQQRIQLVTDLLEQNLPAERFKTDWKPLLKKLDDLLPTRNIFVHHPTRRLATSKDGKAIYEYAIHIEPYERLLNRDHKGLKGKTEIGVEDLKHHAEQVMALESEIRGLVSRLMRGT